MIRAAKRAAATACIRQAPLLAVTRNLSGSAEDDARFSRSRGARSNRGHADSAGEPKQEGKAEHAMPDERGGKDIDPDAAGAVVTIYDSRPSLAVQAASVVFGVKAAAAIGGGLWWGGRVAAEAYEASLAVAEAGASVAAAAEELSGAGATLWGPPALIVVGLATWQVMKRSVTKVVLKIERLVHDDGQGEDIRVTHMPVLPFLQPPSITVPRGDCEAAEADSLTPNFFTVPGGRWYLMPMPGWLSDDKDYLKVFLYWRYFRDTPPPPSDDSLIQIEGFGSYRPMQFADAAHPVAQRIGWPATSEDLAQSPFHGE